MIKEFIDYTMRVRRLSLRTCEEYEKSLREWARWASARGLRWSTTSRKDVETWIKDMSDNELSASTIRTRVSTLRQLYAYMLHHGMIKNNPAQYVATPKVDEQLPRACQMAKVDEYLETAARNYEDGRIHLLTALMVETGIRISEAAQLRRTDFDEQAQTIRVRGKGRRERLVIFGRRTVEALTRYASAATDYLFADLSATDLRWMMYRTLGKHIAGVHPHMLRHTFATEALNAGMPITTVSTLMGHKSVSTTERYAKVSMATATQQYLQFKF